MYVKYSKNIFLKLKVWFVTYMVYLKCSTLLSLGTGVSLFFIARFKKKHILQAVKVLTLKTWTISTLANFNNTALKKIITCNYYLWKRANSWYTILLHIIWHDALHLKPDCLQSETLSEIFCGACFCACARWCLRACVLKFFVSFLCKSFLYRFFPCVIDDKPTCEMKTRNKICYYSVSTVFMQLSLYLSSTVDNMHTKHNLCEFSALLFLFN